jgi:MFS family permease
LRSRILVLVGAIVFVDTMFFAALTPLLKHYVDELDLSKSQVGVLAAMYPAGAFLAGIPSGIAVARFGVKPAVLIGLSLLAVTTTAFGLADSLWMLDAARFLQGVSGAFSWTGGLAWLVAASPAGRRGELIGAAFGTAIAGALFGPVLGATASVTRTDAAFGAVAALALVLAVAAALTPSARPGRPQPLRAFFAAFRSSRIRIGVWLVLVPALLFGNLGVLAPLRLSDLGWGSVAIGATYLVSAALEAVTSPVVGRFSDRRGRLLPLRAALVASAAVCFLLPWPDRAWLLALLVVCAGVAYGIFWTPAMSMVTDEAEARGLDYGYAFALVNLAWAPGQAGGAALGAVVASLTSDKVSYVALGAICLSTLGLVARYSATGAPVSVER